MITKDIKEKIIIEFGNSPKNTGLTEVQVAILTAEIEELKHHFKLNKKDLHSKRGFIAKIKKRRWLLDYLKKQNFNRYKEIIKKLNLRK